ncbi:MAG: PQQ-binding-like beta-propeller repeat protein, partial [Verrucomicrobia bacterium]|nr:PQQ-binding-like beta-propeller repeat protein [Verrucomicrobiota bacterium]
ASKRLPASEQLEKEALRLLDRIGDEKGLLSFLEERLKNDPRREDLKYRLVKAEYLAGKKKAARGRLNTIIDKLEKPERARRLLDLARYLRQMSQPAESADLLTEVVELLPERLDVKRELLETLLALEQRAKAEKILENLSVTDAEIENFVDLVQFMVQADFLVAARNALESRLKSDGERFDLNLLLVSVLGKTGDQEKAEKILIKSREAADTSVRYAQWLESGLSLYELLDSPEQFFDSEQFRFLEEGGEWTAERVDRFLTLCELGDRKKLGDRVAQALRNQLADISLPEPLKLRLRMLLVKALDKSPDNAGEVEQQLKLLAKEDASHADEYQLRRALLYHSNSRPDLARDLLASVDMEKVADDSILRAAYLVFLEYSLVDSAKICLEKLTASQAMDTGGWEKRLSLLAVLGEEEELRVVLRRLLVGVDRMILKSDTLRSLRLHLLDSYWRSISRLLKKDDKESLSAVLVMLDSVDRDAGQTRDRGWSIWARAYALNQLERVAARDEVIKDLRLFLNERSETVEKGDDDNTMIAFPDGLAVSIDAAVDLLKSKQEEVRRDLLKGRKSEGPLGAIEMVWAFEADPGARILQIEPVGEKMVMVLDDQGSVYNIDAENGKLRWHEQYRNALKNGGVISRQSSFGGGSRRTVLGNRSGRIVVTGNSISVSAYSRPYGGARVGSTVGRSSGSFALGVKKVSSMLVDDDGGFFLSLGDQIKAYRSEDGSMLWQSALTATGGEEVKAMNASPAVARPDPVMFLDGDQLLCYAPALNVAVCFQQQTGKLIWSRDLSSSAASKGSVYSLNSGAAFSEGRLFVFGKSCEILDSTSGETLWSFDDRGVHRFPVRLDRVSDSDENQAEPDASATSTNKVSPSPSITASPFAGPRTSALAQPATTFVNHEGDLAGRMSQMKPFLQGEGALVAPAVQWNGARLAQTADADARIEGGRLLLMGSDRVREISLALPVGAQWTPAHGVVLGTIGDAMWFLDGSVLKRLNLRDKQTLSVIIEGEVEGGDVRAVMSGSRIYVSNARGLTILNAHSGNRIGDYEWPGLMADYMAKRIGGGGEGPVGKIATWQGYVRSVPGLPLYCFPLRNRVKGDRIFTMVGEASFAMLRKRRVEDPPK